MSPLDDSDSLVSAGAEPSVAAAAPARRYRPVAQRLRWPLMIGVLLIALLITLVVYLTGGRFQSTDDATVQGARVSVSSSISGRVVNVAVRENQVVKTGQLLFQLDARPLQTAYDAAQANLNQARLQVSALKATYNQRQADLKQAQDNLAYLNGEAARQKALVAAGVATGAQSAQAASQAEQARSQVAAAQAQIANALAALGGDPNLPDDNHPTVRQAQAQLNTASLNQSYVNIYAPQDGVVTKVDQLQVGDYVTAASPVFSLVSTRFWVEAEFKENQLEWMRPGERATVKLDAYPHRTFDARVFAMSPGTGSSFSLLPPENATGNWVKVTQRVPVQIVFTHPMDVPLAAGLSASVRVDTAMRRHLFGPPTPVATPSDSSR